VKALYPVLLLTAFEPAQEMARRIDRVKVFEDSMFCQTWVEPRVTSSQYSFLEYWGFFYKIIISDKGE